MDDGKEDLGRAGGDQQARIQALTQEHETVSQISDNTHVTVTAPNEQRGLIHRFQQCSGLRRKQMQLWRAKGDAESAVAMFSPKHDALASKISAQSKGLPDATAPTATATTPPAANDSSEFSAEQSAAMLRLTKRRSQDQKALATFDKRVVDQTQLASVYERWIGIVAAHQREVLNRALRGIAKSRRQSQWNGNLAALGLRESTHRSLSPHFGTDI